MRKLLLLLAMMAGTAHGGTDGPKVKKDVKRITISSAIRAPGILYTTNKLLGYAEHASHVGTVEVVINSPGGSVFAGLQFVNAMHLAQARGIKIRCYVAGMAASMAFQILAECDERYALRYSLLLWHPVRIAGIMVITPERAKALASELARIEADLLTPIQRELELSEEEFMWRYLHETMWTAEGLVKVSPNFLTIVDDIPGVGAIWNPGRMGGEAKQYEPGTIVWDTKATPKPKDPEPKKDCTTCHRPHKKKRKLFR